MKTRAQVLVFLVLALLGVVLIPSTSGAAAQADTDQGAVAAAAEVVAALEAYEAEHGTYRPAGSGSNGKGIGYYGLENGGKYSLSIANALIAGGYLNDPAPRHPLHNNFGSYNPDYDFFVLPCHDRMAVFTKTETATTDPEHQTWWSNNYCTTTLATDYGYNHLTLTTPPAIDTDPGAVAAAAEVVAALEAHHAEHGTYRPADSGSNGRGIGYYGLENGGKYAQSIANALIAGGYLNDPPPRHPLHNNFGSYNPDYDFFVLPCHDRMAVFTKTQTATTDPEHQTWWSNNYCTTTLATDYGYNHFTLTTPPAIDTDPGAVAAAAEVVAALEAHHAEHGTYRPADSGSNGRGVGFYGLENGGKYTQSIANALIAGGYLNDPAPRHPLHNNFGSYNPDYDFFVLPCHDRMAVFTKTQTATTHPEHQTWWTNNNCTTAGTDYGYNHLTLTTPPAIDTDPGAVAAAAEVVTALEAYEADHGTYRPAGSGSNGKGIGFFGLENGRNYILSIANALIAGGYLNDPAPRHPLHNNLGSYNAYDFFLLPCHDRMAVFTQTQTATTHPDDQTWWTNNNCTTAGTDYGYNHFTLSDAPRQVYVLGNLSGGVAVQDEATDSGYLLYSAQNVHVRFGNALNANNADHFVAAIFNPATSTWQVDTNTGRLPFNPQSSDRLLAALDFAADTASLFVDTVSSPIGGIETGYAGDLEITPNVWAGQINPGEFWLNATALSEYRAGDLPTPCSVPFAPARPNTSPSDSAVTLQIAMPVTPPGCAVLGYQAELTDGAVVNLSEDRVITGFMNGELHELPIRAVSEFGAGPWSQPSESFSTFGTPGSATITASTTSGVYHWTIQGADNNGSPLSGYTLTGDVTNFSSNSTRGTGRCVNSLNKPCLAPSTSIKSPASTRTCLQRADTVSVSGFAENAAGDGPQTTKGLQLSGCPAQPGLTLESFDGKYTAEFTRPAGTDRMYVQVNSNYGGAVSGTKKLFSGSNGTTYTVRAWACNEFGCVASTTKTVKVGDERTVTLGQGARTAGCCDFMVATISGFKPNTTYHVVGNAIAGPYPQGADTDWCPNWNITTNSNGYGYSTNYCYYGWWGNDVKITVDGVSSLRIDWKVDAPTKGRTADVGSVPDIGGGTTSNRSITLSQGSRTAGCCDFMNVSISGFAPNTTYHVVGEAKAGPYPQGADTDWCPNWTIRTNSSGNGSGNNHCYYGWWGNDVRVSVDGVSSGWVDWSINGGGSSSGSSGGTSSGSSGTSDTPTISSGSNGDLIVSWVNNPFPCDSITRTLGSISGFQPNEVVRYSSPDTGDLIDGRANSTGTATMQWYCGTAGTWSLTATGASSGRSTTMIVRGTGQHLAEVVAPIVVTPSQLLTPATVPTTQLDLVNGQDYDHYVSWTNYFVDRSMAHFQANKNSVAERIQWLDWSDDGCSKVRDSVVGVFDFRDACERHDFCYRNFENARRKYIEKDRCDARFDQDMIDHCNQRSFTIGGVEACLGWGIIYASGVIVFG